MTELAKGGNTSLTADRIQIAVSGAAPGSVDLLVFQVNAAGKVRSDADMVFFNQPASPEGAIRLTGTDRLEATLSGVPAEIVMLVVSVALDESVPGSLAAVPGLAAWVADGDVAHSAPAAGLTAERAAILGEIYRRGDGWKFRNVSAGWNSGLADLAREYGVTVDEAPKAPSAQTQPTQPAAPTAPFAAPAGTPAAGTAPPLAVSDIGPATPAPGANLGLQPTQPGAGSGTPQGPRSVPGEQALSLEKRQQLDLRKQQVHQVLLTKSAAGTRARVLLVLDKTGSMSREYKKGIVHRVVERMVPVAIQLDDDGTLECYLYAEQFYKLPDLRVEQLEPWIADHVHLTGTHSGLDYRRIGMVNDEIPIMTEIVSQLRAADPLPTLVLFFTDGGFHNRKPIIDLITQAAALPAFWQFVGIGKRGSFGVLEQLDDLQGRVVDNVGFFPVPDIDKLDDAELYRLLLSEFPDWLAAARARRIVG